MDVLQQLAARHGIPLIEDAAHSLGTLWNGRRIGTLGAVGCFSFQSYKLVNGGEGGILITDDAQIAARAVIMSGAYEHNWKKHDTDAALVEALARWQNRLPLYNTRMSNLSAAVIRPQLPQVPARVAAGRRNHDHLAARLDDTPFFSVPAPLPGEARAPDSIQFNLIGMGEAEVAAFVARAREGGVNVQVFGQSTDNARAFWNWGFLPPESGATVEALPKTAAMLRRACDVRLPVRLTVTELDGIAEVLTEAAATARAEPAFGT
jgi:dTDP-4-amino-4,6-dideoxygalactose transaminase